MRRPVLTGIAAAAVLAATAGPAVAGTAPPDPAPGGPQRPYEPDVDGPRNLDTLSVTATKGAGRSVTIAFDRHSRTASGQVPAAARRFVFLFDRSVRFNPQAFPTCAHETIEEKGAGACPPGSRIGGGRATYLDGSRYEVQAFNTRVGRLPGVLVVIPAAGVILEQTFEPVSAPYRGDYRWALDEILPPTPTPPQDRLGTSRFELSFGATTVRGGRTVGFAETTARPGTRLRFGLWSEFVTGQVVLPTSGTRLS
ncbi:hypothetical protein Acsp04_30870 [Actinomadura sp. NBRC 104425]|uniref:hypothetical protein n=1 Tax=Actinomadura sp. NBRC 104425 TaxID=3032204 RepID=UPI0024A02D56|nr:hypothetical protein [Actinomadura sp. NBRC 104425]GLZ12852.1 hypothetical protein Acsp04_30870 [Actinomadura sp. NBRC 104425]